MFLRSYLPSVRIPYQISFLKNRSFKKIVLMKASMKVKKMCCKSRNCLRSRENVRNVEKMLKNTKKNHKNLHHLPNHAINLSKFMHDNCINNQFSFIHSRKKWRRIEMSHFMHCVTFQVVFVYNSIHFFGCSPVVSAFCLHFQIVSIANIKKLTHW